MDTLVRTPVFKHQERKEKKEKIINIKEIEMAQHRHILPTYR